MTPLEQLPLRSFLGCCRGDWGPRELRAVQRKLAAIDVEDVGALMRRVKDGSLNERLDMIGERRFAADTLEGMQSAAVQLGKPFRTSVSKDSSRESVGVEDLSSHVMPDDKSDGPRLPSPAAPAVGTSGKSMLFGKGIFAGGGLPANRRVPPSLDFDFLDDDDFVPRSPGGPHVNSSIGRWAGGRLAGEPDDEAATLRQQICRGLSQVDAVAAEAKRRNGEVTRCLAEVQADIARITERMCAARQRKDRRSSSYASRDLPAASSSASASSAPKARARPSASQPAPPPPPSATPAGPPPSGQPSMLPRRPGSEHRQRRQSSELRGPHVGPGAQQARQPREATGTRGMQSGFTFGGQPRPLRAPPLEAGNAGLGSASRAPDPGAQAQEAVRSQLLAMSGRPEADRKACVKRLLVKWHPDRNPDSIEEATAVFQYIQQEKERLLGL